MMRPDHPGAREPVLESVDGPRDRRNLAMRGAVGFAVVQVVMLLNAICCALAHLVTLFHARRFCINVIAPRTSRLVMWLLGIKVHFHGFEDLPSPCIVTANHTSTLDLFILSMLPIPNKRSFMARWTRIFPPLAVIGWSTGTIFTPPQPYPEARIRCFQRAERILRETGDSCYLSPEGIRWTTPKVGPFNKGTFHLAAALDWPIVPLYIDIPRNINPGVGFKTRPGVVHVYARPPIATTDWRGEDAVIHKEEVRALYLAYPAGWGVVS